MEGGHYVLNLSWIAEPFDKMIKRQPEQGMHWQTQCKRFSLSVEEAEGHCLDLLTFLRGEVVWVVNNKLIDGWRVWVSFSAVKLVSIYVLKISDVIFYY